MKAEALRAPARFKPAVLASLFASLLASCTAANDPAMNVGSPAFATSGTAALSAPDAGGGDPASAGDEDSGEAAFATEKPAPKAVKPLQGGEGRAAARPGAVQAAVEASAAGDGIKRGTEAGPAQLAAAAPPGLIGGDKREFLSSFLSKQQGKPLIGRNPVPLGAGARNADARKLVQLASAEPGAGASAHLYDNDALPGVRQTMLFEIKRKSGIDDESDVDLHEEDEASELRMASAGGMARLAPNGLLKQNDTVDTACLKPGLVAILRSAEQHFGQKMVITSGYRDPAHNRRVRGAKKSMHMACAAADVQIAGVSRWELASYFRSMPGRGGVGTYCHTASVHVDIGPERDWNWKCGRRG